jgi:hypothetical protein
VLRVPNPRVPLRSSRRGLHCSAFGSSIEPPNLRQSMDLTSAPASVFFPSESPPWISTLVLHFFSPPYATSLSFPTSPRRRDPHPCARAPARGAAPAAGRGGRRLGRRSPQRRRRNPLQAWPGALRAWPDGAAPVPRRRPSSSLPLLSGTIIRGTLKAPNSQLVTPISIKLQRPDGHD